MTRGRELVGFAVTLAALVLGFFHESLLGDKILGSADVLLASASFRELASPQYEPANRLLMDPTLQFEPWIEFNRRMIRSGRLPLWNSASGCGAPHLANGQAAVFDPFLLLAYVGSVPTAFAWMAAARLWFAGVGAFLLGRAWGLGGWGRWFAGLAFPFSGFLVVWLLYPVTNVAIWLPWTLLATQRIWEQPTTRRAALLALAIGGTLLGGHVQTAAHVLLAVAAYAGWLAIQQHSGRAGVGWIVAVSLGIALAAIEVGPLAVYLTRSPVWGDRDQERVAPWKLVRPRVLEAVCTALPALYGSQRRGEPNLARAIGVDNQNESAGGFAGLATLTLLAPLGWLARRDRPIATWLAGLTLFGCAAAFRFPPVDNLLRSLPVLKVTDNRRLTLWIAFGLVMLGGCGLDAVGELRRSRRWNGWVLGSILAAIGAIGGALAAGQLGPHLQQRATAHYAAAAAATPGADPVEYQARADRQVAATLRFVPRYLTLVAANLTLLAGLVVGFRRGRCGVRTTRVGLIVLALTDLVGFGFGLNPAISRAVDRPVTTLITDLRREVGVQGRIIGLGAEFPPNSLMRYGLKDARNYDSVETRRNLDWLRPLYDPEVAAQTSRRDINWSRVVHARDRLREAGVRAVVGATPPPTELGRVTRYDAVWVAWLDAEPLVSLRGAGQIQHQAASDGQLVVDLTCTEPARLIVRETFDPGWMATVAGSAVNPTPHQQAFIEVPVPAGSSRVVLEYRPIEVKLAAAISGFAALVIVFALTGIHNIRSTRIVVPRLGRTQAFGLESDS